jgi:hypothetical protein
MLVVLRVKEFPPFSWGIFICRTACLILIMSKRAILAFLLISSGFVAKAQTLGGNAIYSFLKLPFSAHAAALGGRNISNFGADLSLISENPSLLKKEHHASFGSSFQNIAPTVTGLYGVGAFHQKKINTTFSLGFTHILYGEEQQTDASGNVLGSFKSYDQALAVSASRTYGSRWRYGVTLKLLNSRYGIFRSTGLATDMGLSYFDETNQLQIAFAAKNMGIQLNTFGAIAEDLPFDLVLGMTKQLEKAPLRFSVTAQRIHQFDLLYNDTLFSNENFGVREGTGFAKKILSHFILGTEVLLGDKIVLLAGYNVLRRSELKLRNLSNGLTGFSYGMQLKLKRLNFYYSRSHYQTSLSQHQLTFSIQLQNQK